jgi:microsomal epoxide hydrolase
MAPSNPYSTLPANATGKIEPFEIHISNQELQDFETLLRLSPIAKDSYENQEVHKEKDFRGYGVTRQWMIKAKKYWEEEFDWRQEEAHINSFPQFKATVQDDDGRPFTIHFVALFSRKEGPIPVVQTHGWPSTFAEFLPELDLLRIKYSPEELPYHIIVPSPPGWTFSDAPPLDRDWTYSDSARIIHKLMLMLGFGNGYAAQGGDIGAGISRNIAATYTECKALHLNFSYMGDTDWTEATESTLSTTEQEGLQRHRQFAKTDNAYGKMHGTRTSTIGQVLSSSPLGLLAWIGEKYLEWTDQRHRIPLPIILTEVSLYWFSGCAGTSLYTYREDYLLGVYQKGYLHGLESLHVDKPMGYSYFPKEISPMPKKWVERTGKLVWCRYHDEGGHFPALERTEVLLGDMEGFLSEVWK